MLHDGVAWQWNGRQPQGDGIPFTQFGLFLGQSYGAAPGPSA